MLVYIRFNIQSGHKNWILLTRSESVTSKLLSWNHVSSILCPHVSACLCVFPSCLSLSSCVPCQDRLPVLEPLSPPDFTPECPVRTPSVNRYTQITASLCFIFLHYLCYIFWFWHVPVGKAMVKLKLQAVLIGPLHPLRQSGHDMTPGHGGLQADAAPGIALHVHQVVLANTR